MSVQEEGLVGKAVGGMVRRTVRKRLKGIYWTPPEAPIAAPALFACNHHGWFDGHVMFHVVSRLGLRSVLWMEELGAFPLFARVGCMPFPKDDAAVRSVTVRRTIRLMKTQGRSLVLFPEGVMHYPPDVLEFGRGLELVARRVENVSVIPVALRYEASMHERPEAFVSFGAPLAAGTGLSERARTAVQMTLDSLTRQIRENRDALKLLARGTDDVNERWDMRKTPGGGR